MNVLPLALCQQHKENVESGMTRQSRRGGSNGILPRHEDTKKPQSSEVFPRALWISHLSNLVSIIRAR